MSLFDDIIDLMTKPEKNMINPVTGGGPTFRRIKNKRKPHRFHVPSLFPPILSGVVAAIPGLSALAPIPNGILPVILDKFPNLPLLQGHSAIPDGIKELFHTIISSNGFLDVKGKSIAACIYIFTGIKIDPKKFCALSDFNAIENIALFGARQLFTVAFPEIVIAEEFLKVIEKVIHIDPDVKVIIVQLIGTIATKGNLDRVIGTINCDNAGNVTAHPMEPSQTPDPNIPVKEPVIPSHRLDEPEDEDADKLNVRLTFPTVSDAELRRVLDELARYYDQIEDAANDRPPRTHVRADELNDFNDFHIQNEQMAV